MLQYGMKVQFTIHDKPISVNNAYIGPRRVLTKAGRLFRASVWTAMNGSKELIEAFKSQYADKPLELTITVNIPAKYFYTKEGHISIRSMDLDNQLKVLIDCMFNKRYAGLDSKGKPYTDSCGNVATVFAINDINICNIKAYKRPSIATDWSIEIELTAIKL